jgi:lysophospholipase L1-like esterase
MITHLLFGLERALLAAARPLLKSSSKRIISEMPRLSTVSEWLHLKGTSSKDSILVIGESTAAGVGASSEEFTFSAQLYGLMDQKYSITNIGKKGLKAAQMREELEAAKDKNISFPLAIILIGANDCFQFSPPRDFAEAVSGFVLDLKNKFQTKHIVFQTIPPVHRFPAIPLYGKILLGLHRYLLNLELKKLQQNSSFHQLIGSKNKYAKAFFAADGIHPSDLGYKTMAKVTDAFLRKTGLLQTCFDEEKQNKQTFTN